MALLEKVSPWTLRPQKSTSFPVSLYCLMLVEHEVNSLLLYERHACLPNAMLPPMLVMDSNPLELMSN